MTCQTILMQEIKKLTGTDKNIVNFGEVDDGLLVKADLCRARGENVECRRCNERVHMP